MNTQDSCKRRILEQHDISEACLQLALDSNSSTTSGSVCDESTDGWSDSEDNATQHGTEDKTFGQDTENRMRSNQGDGLPLQPTDRDTVQKAGSSVASDGESSDSSFAFYAHSISDVDSQDTSSTLYTPSSASMSDGNSQDMSPSFYPPPPAYVSSDYSRLAAPSYVSSTYSQNTATAAYDSSEGQNDKRVQPFSTDPLHGYSSVDYLNEGYWQMSEGSDDHKHSTSDSIGATSTRMASGATMANTRTANGVTDTSQAVAAIPFQSLSDSNRDTAQSPLHDSNTYETQLDSYPTTEIQNVSQEAASPRSDDNDGSYGTIKRDASVASYANVVGALPTILEGESLENDPYFQSQGAEPSEAAAISASSVIATDSSSRPSLPRSSVEQQATGRRSTPRISMSRFLSASEVSLKADARQAAHRRQVAESDLASVHPFGAKIHPVGRSMETINTSSSVLSSIDVVAEASSKEQLCKSNRLLKISTATGIVLTILAAIAVGVALVSKQVLSPKLCGVYLDRESGYFLISLGGLTREVNETEVEFMEQLFDNAYNNVSDGCDDVFQRFSRTVMLEQQELAMAADGQPLLDTKWRMDISCNGCPWTEPLFSNETEHSHDARRVFNDSDHLHKNIFRVGSPQRKRFLQATSYPCSASSSVDPENFFELCEEGLLRGKNHGMIESTFQQIWSATVLDASGNQEVVVLSPPPELPSSRPTMLPTPYKSPSISAMPSLMHSASPSRYMTIVPSVLSSVPSALSAAPSIPTPRTDSPTSWPSMSVTKSIPPAGFVVPTAKPSNRPTPMPTTSTPPVPSALPPVTPTPTDVPSQSPSNTFTSSMIPSASVAVTLVPTTSQSVVFQEIRSQVLYGTLCMTLLPRTDDANVNKITLRRCGDGLLNQHWFIDVKGMIRSALDYTKCITVEDLATQNGSPILVEDCLDDSSAQKWTYTTEGELQLQSNPMMCMDGNYPRGDIDTWKCELTDDQLWII